MKTRKFRLLKQKGQSLVEFVLLLTVISGISYGFVAFMNRNLKRYWEHHVNLIINDGTTLKENNVKQQLR